MRMASVYALPVAVFFTRSKDPSAASSTENNFPGPPALFSGGASSHHGDALAAGSLLISLFAVALVILSKRLTPPGQDGSRSSPSTSIDSQEKKRTGGTAKEQYEET